MKKRMMVFVFGALLSVDFTGTADVRNVPYSDSAMLSACTVILTSLASRTAYCLDNEGLTQGIVAISYASMITAAYYNYKYILELSSKKQT